MCSCIIGRGTRTSLVETDAHACMEPNRDRSFSLSIVPNVFHRFLISRRGKLYRFCFCRMQGWYANTLVPYSPSPSSSPNRPPYFQGTFAKTYLYEVELSRCFVLLATSSTSPFFSHFYRFLFHNFLFGILYRESKRCFSSLNCVSLFAIRCILFPM